MSFRILDPRFSFPKVRGTTNIARTANAVGKKPAQMHFTAYLYSLWVDSEHTKKNQPFIVDSIYINFDQQNRAIFTHFCKYPKLPQKV